MMFFVFFVIDCVVHYMKSNKEVDGTFTFHFQHFTRYSHSHTERAIFCPIDVALSKIKITNTKKKRKTIIETIPFSHLYSKLKWTFSLNLIVFNFRQSKQQGILAYFHFTRWLCFLPYCVENSTLLLLFYLKLPLNMNLLFAVSFCFILCITPSYLTNSN